MASAAIDEIDYFDLSASAARRLKVSPASLIRFEAIRLQLAAHGIRKSDQRIPLWIAPMFCTTPEARRLFFESFPKEPPKVGQLPKDRKRSAAADRRAKRRLRTRPRVGWRKTLLGAILILAIAAFVALVVIPQFRAEPEFANQSTDLTNTTSPPPGSNSPPPTEEPPRGPTLRTWLALGLPALLASAYVIWLRRRRRIIRRDHAPAPERSVRLAFATGLENFLAERSLRKAMGNLRRHRPVISSKLNVPAAIRATIRSAGFPQMRYGFRPRSPEYLVLNERESPTDHLAVIGHVMARRMTEEHVAHSRYEYFGDPRRLQRIERGSPAGVFPLSTELARHDGARVMLLQESHDCFAEDNSPEWLARIAETERPVLLNPRSPDAWGSAETRLTSLGFGIFSPNGRGIADYGDYLNTTGNVRRRLARSNATRFDLPESLARDRNLLLDNEPPLDSLIGELVTDLDLWLDEGGGYWLRGLALFPYIDPGFTVFLGKALVDGDGRPLLEEARFFDLARLPWLRAGRMPDWLRRALVRGLTPAQLEAATDAIQAFLMPADQPEGEAKIDFSRGKDPRLRKRLLDWLKLTPESLLSDQLLIEALGGRAAEELGLEAPKTLLRHSRSLWASNEARAVAIAAAATIVIGAWQWPTLFPEPTTAQATTETRTPTQGEVAPFEPLFPEEEKEPILDAAGRALDEAGNTSDAGNANADANASNLAGSANDAKDNTNAAKDALEAAADAVERAAEAATTSETEILAGPFVLFLDADTTVITPDTEAALRRIADAYKNEVGSRGNIEPGLVQIIVRIYSNPSDGALGRRLGRSIEDWLTGRGIPPSEIVVQSVGGTVPTKASMVTASAVQRTLRVEISLVANYGKAPTAN